MSDEHEKKPLHRFAHGAMNATFEVIVADQPELYAAQAADAVFAEIDRAERVLSRFIDSSDITRLNRAGAGAAVRVDEATFACLEAAARVHADTGGAFDVTVGPLMACWRNPDSSPRTPPNEEIAAARARVGMHLIDLDPATFSVRLKAGGMCIDLGGIGKGFALDRGAEVLAEWDIETALLHGGGSTVLAVGAPPGEPGWSVGVGGGGETAAEDWEKNTCEGANTEQNGDCGAVEKAEGTSPSEKPGLSQAERGTSGDGTGAVEKAKGAGPSEKPGLSLAERGTSGDGTVPRFFASTTAADSLPIPRKVRLRDRALSGSGIEAQGHHIFDPRKGRPARGKIATWAVCPSAAEADALSTAFVVLSPGEVEAYCKRHPDTCAMLLIERGGKPHHVRYGDWEPLLAS